MNGTLHDLPGGIGKRLQKPHVQLDQIQRIVIQKTQRRIPASEIIHPDRKPIRAKLSDNRGHLLLVSDKHALSQLERNQVMPDLILIQNTLRIGSHIDLFKILPGQID